MAVQLEDIATTTATGQNGSFTFPNGVPADGDLIVLFMHTNDAEDTNIEAAGFTVEIAYADNGLNGKGGTFAYKFASSESSATYDFATSGFPDAGVMMVLSGVDSASPFTEVANDTRFKRVIYGTHDFALDPDGDVLPVTGISVTADGLILAVTTRTNTSSSTAFADPGGTFTLQSPSSGFRSYAWTKAVTSTGTEPGVSVATAANRDHFSYFVGLNPSAGGAGPVVWSGSVGSLEVSSDSGTFGDGGAPQTWTGADGSLAVSAAVDTFQPGLVVWSGSAGTLEVSSDSGSFLVAGAPQTWTGDTIGVTAVPDTGEFAAGVTTWVGDASSIAATPNDGAFSGSPPPLTWSGSAGSFDVSGLSGSFVAGSIVWAGSPNTINLTVVSAGFVIPGASNRIGPQAMLVT